MKAKRIHGSRRRLLVRAATVFAGMAAVVALPPPVRAKAAKGDFLYQDQPHDGKRCELCIHFLKPSGCKLVTGPISAQGWCRLFSATA